MLCNLLDCKVDDYESGIDLASKNEQTISFILDTSYKVRVYVDIRTSRLQVKERG